MRLVAKFLLRKNHNYWVWLMLVLPQTEKMAYTTWRRWRRVVDVKVYLDQWDYTMLKHTVITCYLFFCRCSSDEFYMGKFTWEFVDGVKSVVCRGKIFLTFMIVSVCTYWTLGYDDIFFWILCSFFWVICLWFSVVVGMVMGFFRMFLGSFVMLCYTYYTPIKILCELFVNEGGCRYMSFL